MRVYLVRHAIAEPRGPVWPVDDDRPLTPRGIERMREIALRLADRGVQVERIWSSPILRARQTADLLAPLWTTGRVVDEVAELATGCAPARAGEALAARPPCASVALVGHEPQLGALAAWMIGAEAPLPFKKGGVARVDFADGIAAGEGKLAWLVTPKLVLAD
ncbi:MAG: phosphohistidine phosphatase SixA [Acidimicrobiia bacterium]|nr:phosphohistidine phosphatase SixA [Acidimicrobiia bacterium]